MKQSIITIILLLVSGYIFGQDLKILEPTIGPKLDFSPQFIAKFNSPEFLKKCAEVWNKIQESGRDYTQINPKEQEILQYCDETKQNVWDIIGEGCNWYEAGGPKKVTASSFLKGQGHETYKPQNVHDLNYKNAWAEGVPGYGIGEYLVYYFAPESPRINKIIVVNGYVKNQSSWENNSRAKQLKMYVSNKPYAILNLKDVRAEQSFKVNPIGNSRAEGRLAVIPVEDNNRAELNKLETKPEWTIKIEILDVYKGSKYDDVVITEIYFDGLDVH